MELHHFRPVCVRSERGGLIIKYICMLIDWSKANTCIYSITHLKIKNCYFVYRSCCEQSFWLSCWTLGRGDRPVLRSRRGVFFQDVFPNRVECGVNTRHSKTLIKFTDTDLFSHVMKHTNKQLYDDLKRIGLNAFLLNFCHFISKPVYRDIHTCILYINIVYEEPW